MQTHGRRKALGGLMLLALSSCATPYPTLDDSALDASAASLLNEEPPPVCEEDVYKQEMTALRVEIEDEIGDPLASRIEWCQVLTLGDLRLVYSTWRSDEAEVEALGAVYRDVYADYKHACLNGIYKLTRPVPRPPRVALVNGRCIIE